MYRTQTDKAMVGTETSVARPQPRDCRDDYEKFQAHSEVEHIRPSQSLARHRYLKNCSLYF